MRLDPNLRKLVELGGNPLDSPPPLDDRSVTAEWGALGNQLFTMLQAKNGFYALESSLHVFPLIGRTQRCLTLEEWNAPTCWKASYGPLIEQSILCFAEDVFGGQFCLKDAEVARFDPETGALRSIADDLDAWAQLILRDYSFQTGYGLAHDWQMAHGALPIGHRLLPKKPFVIGGQYALDNLFAMDAVAGMRLRGEIAQKIADLPDGTEVEIEYY